MLFKALSLMFFLTCMTFACSIPVYRYAITQWDTDPYDVVVFRNNQLTPAQTKAIAAIKAFGAKQPSGAPLRVQVVSISDSSTKAYKKLLNEGAQLSFPWAAVMFPKESGIPVPLWMGELDSVPLKSLTDSPVRTTLFDRLTHGQTAVWILSESGDPKKDAAALKNLDNGLKMSRDSLKLPQITKEDREQMGKLAEGLAISFSVVKVSRADARERSLVKILMSSERGMGAFEHEPMAFPIFGRGRLLYALVGKGINNKTILQANSFLTGPCSCTIKEQNPGKDVLMACQWGPLQTPASVSNADNADALPRLRSMSSAQCLTKKDSLSATVNTRLPLTN